MAAPVAAGSGPKPEVGDILLVIHDFQARSSDELTLARGDRVELVERDDEFGDGWYLGRHLVNQNSGLFPEVYTRPAPKNVIPTNQPRLPPASQLQQPLPALAEAPSPEERPLSATKIFDEKKPEPEKIEEKLVAPQAALQTDIKKAVSAPVLGLSDSKPPPTPSTAPLPINKTLPALNGSGTTSTPTSAREDSAVLHETLNVIDEHIDNLRKKENGQALNDSGSEYSSHLENRLSYIQGEETDEEDEGSLTRSEVAKWSPDQVAEHLFTAGVEKQHCEVFRDQEITGEVLLGMDQSSIFLKAFDLGSVGRRLKTWQKIKAMQDEANGVGFFNTRRTTQTYGSETGSEDVRRPGRSRTGTLTSAAPSTLPSSLHPDSSHNRLSMASSTPNAHTPTSLTSPMSPSTKVESPTRPLHQSRPSAASVRDLHHSRRFSSTDFRGSSTGAALSAGTTPTLAQSTTMPTGESGAHKKQPSFDRNWTLGGARPLSSTNLNDILAQSITASTDGPPSSSGDLDRGYYSNVEGDGKKRNTLRKRDSAATHSRNASYTEEQRMRSATALARHSRFGSMGSTRHDSMSSAAKQYYGVGSNNPHRRTLSTNTVDQFMRPIVPSKDSGPTVTKLDNADSPNISSPISPANRQSLKPGGLGSRAISDAVTGQERKAAVGLDSPLRESSPLQSPSRTESSTPSAPPSLDIDSPDLAKSPNMQTMAVRPSVKKKGKKETSAYTRGLLKMTPREAMKEADYSGWMKKKSSALMTTWKPRLFVLKGRRLAYYYSEDDDSEKGLIDISFHRVLPADHDKLTGLHATLTGASTTPTAPAHNHIQTTAEADAAADPTAASDSIFIFKLVPPRSGLSRAVTFTKPTVHYFAVPNIKQGRLWMAALMKATIDRDDTQAITTTYQQKTISLAKARQMRHRPPALMNLDEKVDEGDDQPGTEESTLADTSELQKANAQAVEANSGLGISLGGGSDSGVSGLEKLGLHQVESARSRGGNFLYAEDGQPSSKLQPQSA